MLVRSRAAVLCLAVVVSTAVAACGAEVPAAGPVATGNASASPSPSPSAAAVAGPAPAASRAARPAAAPLTADPLTGRRPVPSGSVVAVKIDNAPLARRYTRGLDQAALVYQELVESGASRFLAVFRATAAGEVGPVRSARDNDLELVRQFGRVALASSGANAGVRASLARAAREGRVLDAGFDVAPRLYRRAERRSDAYNFFTSPAAVDRARPGGSSVHDVGLRFGALPAGVGAPAPRATVRFSPATRVVVQYEPARGSWAVFQDGDRMRGFAPTNVVVQSVPVLASQYVDVTGNRTPYTRTVGTGHVDVLRDGRRLSGTWRRPVADAGTRLVDAAGRDLPLKPGSTLVLLLPADRSMTVG